MRVTRTGEQDARGVCENKLTEEVIKNSFAQGSADLHEVGQAVEVFSARDPVRLV